MGRPVLKTKLCDILGIEYPILSAGMGPSLVGEKTGAPVELVVAVSEAGGCGVLGAAGYTVDEMRDAIREIKKLTKKPFGVDLLLPSQTVSAGDQEYSCVQEMPLKEILKTLPKAHYEWIMKIKEEMSLPDIEGKFKSGSTSMRDRKSVV